ncbi:MAG: hypothetical protein ABI718_14905, partial [Acidobacteriota bacterium]
SIINSCVSTLDFCTASEGAQRPKDLFNEEWAGNREGGRDPSLDAQDDSRAFSPFVFAHFSLARPGSA